MKSSCLALFGVALLASCNQTAPATEKPAVPAATAPATTPTAGPASADSAAAPADGVATAPTPAAAAPSLREATPLTVSFSFRPAPDPDDPAHPRTSAHLLVQGAKAMDVDLGKFAGKPDVVDATKARLANFPAGMLMGFRSYQPATGTSSDLAVLHVDGRYLRIVQRRVEETAPEAGKFETSREIPLPANTRVLVKK